jgi:formylglycine-generating enzyme required for sulfatase activity
VFLITNWAIADTFGSEPNTFEIQFVTIATPGNPPDFNGDPNPAGKVDRVFRMGKYEISRDMVNKANSSGSLNITLSPMNFVVGGPRPDMPATGVSWNEAARFVNWLNLSHGYPAAYKFETQSGEADYDANENILVWQASDHGFDAINRFRNSLAYYFLPSVDEWYKAAYFDPDAGGGAGGYWAFANGRDMAPIPVARASEPGTAVYEEPFEHGPADVSLAGGMSPYGVVGLRGNVWELLETERDLVNDDPQAFRIQRGGSWSSGSADLSVSYYFNNHAGNGTRATGFRVASVVELELAGDFNRNGVLDIADLDALTYYSASGMNLLHFDFNSDGLVDGRDVNIWIKARFHSWIGDANLDRQFSSQDLIDLFAAGTYETNMDAVWSTGDLNGSGRFDSGDLIDALADGGYELGPRPTVAAVPEPGGIILLLLSLCGLPRGGRTVR